MKLFIVAPKVLVPTADRAATRHSNDNSASWKKFHIQQTTLASLRCGSAAAAAQVLELGFVGLASVSQSIETNTSMRTLISPISAFKDAFASRIAAE
ncbi:MAG: hypothetical protein WDM81_09520 [Rhizomicrobium sp.]